MQNSDHLLLVNGIGGVGKTTLSMKYCAEFASHYDHILWFFCEHSIAEGILADGRTEKMLGINSAPQATYTQRLQDVFTALSKWEGNNLMVIDNANKSKDIRETDFNCPNWKILLTTRADMGSSSRFRSKKINVLSDELAAELFCKYYPPAEESPDLLKRLLLAIDNHTLVIELLAKTLHIRSEMNYTLAKLCDDLENHGVLSLPASTKLTPNYLQYRHKQLRPETIIQKMYNQANLGEGENLILQYFSIFPADFIPISYLVYLFQIGENEQFKFQDQLNILAEKGWLDKSTAGYKLHQIMQSVVRNSFEPTCDYFENLINHLIQSIESSNITQSHWLVPYANSVLQQVKGVNNALRSLCYELCDAYYELGKLLDALEIAEHYEKVCLELDDQEHLSIVYDRKGNIYKSMGEIDKALHFFELDMSLNKELLGANPKSEHRKNSLAISYTKMGDSYLAQRNWDEALHYFKLYAQLSEELHQKNPTSPGLKNDLAISYSRLGEINLSIGKTEEAIQYFEMYSDLKSQLNQDFPDSEEHKNGLAISNLKLGEAYEKQGDLERALQFFTVFSTLSEEVQKANPKSEKLRYDYTISQQKLGNVYLKQNQIDLAFNCYQKYLNLAQQLFKAAPRNYNNEFILAHAYSCIGDIFVEQKNPEARDYFLQSEKHYQALFDKTKISAFENNLDIVRKKLQRMA